MNKIKGIIAPMLTAFKENGEFDEVKTRKFIDYLIDKGIDGMHLTVVPVSLLPWILMRGSIS